MCPDYLIVPTGGNPEILPRVVEAFKAAHKTFYPDGAPLKSESFAHIVSRSHYLRLCDLLGRTKGSIVFGGGTDEGNLKIEPTVLTGISADDALMEGEIFGPVLPIMEVDTVEDACEFIESRWVFVVLLPVRRALIGELQRPSFGLVCIYGKRR